MRRARVTNHEFVQSDECEGGMTMATTKSRAKTKTKSAARTSKKAPTKPAKMSRADQRRARIKAGDKLLALVKKIRADSWVNLYTGYGTARDKTAVGYFDPSSTFAIDPVMWIALYEGDAIAARIVDLIPEDMVRQGLTLTRKKGEIASDETAEVEAVSDTFKRLNVTGHLEDGLIWGRCTGGALMYIVCDDGAPADTALDLARVRSVTSLKVYDRTRVTIDTTYQNPKHPKFGQPKTYRIDPIDGTVVGEGGIVHESRCWRFGGARTSDRTKSALAGWELSILQRVYDGIRKFHEDHKVASLLMSDASQGVLKMAGIIDSIAAGNWDEVHTRLLELEQMRGVGRAVVVDPEEGEDFTKVQNTFAGVSDILDRDANYLAAITGYPVTLLMGQAPAGLNATGDSDIRLFYDRVRTKQESELKPPILRLIEIITRGKVKGWDVVFPPLWQESPSEKADRELKQAQRDQIYYTIEVVHAEEVALSPHLETVYPNLDRESRRALLEAEAAAPALSAGPGSAANDEPEEPVEAETEDEEAIDEEPARYARELTEYVNPTTGVRGAERCQHMRKNRCRDCMVERVRRIVGSGLYGEPVHANEWRAIGRKVEAA